MIGEVRPRPCENPEWNEAGIREADRTDTRVDETPAKQVLVIAAALVKETRRKNQG
jgi:hypothetical protein